MHMMDLHAAAQRFSKPTRSRVETGQRLVGAAT